MRRRTRRVDFLVDDDHLDFYHVVVMAGDPVIFQARSRVFNHVKSNEHGYYYYCDIKKN